MKTRIDHYLALNLSNKRSSFILDGITYAWNAKNAHFDITDREGRTRISDSSSVYADLFNTYFHSLIER